MISYSHKFIFVHVYKVAGSSIRKALQAYTGLPEFNKILIKLGLQKNYEDKIWHHSRANEIQEALPKKMYDKFFKFAFVRNPWDWQVSLYHYMLKDTSHFQHEQIKKMSSYEEYIEWRVSQDLHFQKEFVTDRDGKIIVDFIGKYENLSEDFSTVCNKLGLKVDLPHVNQSKRKPYQEYYNDFTRKLIEDYCKEDIEFFGYTFDDN